MFFVRCDNHWLSRHNNPSENNDNINNASQQSPNKFDSIYDNTNPVLKWSRKRDGDTEPVWFKRHSARAVAVENGTYKYRNNNLTAEVQEESWIGVCLCLLSRGPFIMQVL